MLTALMATMPTPCHVNCLPAHCSWYLDTQGPRLDRDPRALRQRFGRLGWAGVIAFPHLFARSFGVFGSEQVLAHLTRCLLAG